MTGAATWRIGVKAPVRAAPAIAEVLENHCAAVSWLGTDGDGDITISGYGVDEPDRAAIMAALEPINADLGLLLSADISPVAPRDWLAETVRQFPPITVGRYFIHGNHFADRVPLGHIGLNIGAGAAFGSGEHASTAGCLLALQGLAKERRFRTPLDVGCGSGILAIAMAKTLRLPVLATDIDAVAVAVTTQNALRNGVGPMVRAARGAGYQMRAVRRAAPFDLIVANILARPLCRMAGDLGRHLAPGGRAVLSGLIARDGPRVLAAHRRAGLSLRRRIIVDGWLTLILGR